jgi:hypothetical protein
MGKIIRKKPSVKRIINRWKYNVKEAAGKYYLHLVDFNTLPLVPPLKLDYHLYPFIICLRGGVSIERGLRPLSNSLPSPARKSPAMLNKIGWRGVRGEV